MNKLIQTTTYQQGLELDKLGIKANGFFSWKKINTDFVEVTEDLALSGIPFYYTNRLPAFTFCEMWRCISTKMANQYMFPGAINPVVDLCDLFIKLATEDNTSEYPEYIVNNFNEKLTKLNNAN
jgi:hypothetical protein